MTDPAPETQTNPQNTPDLEVQAIGKVNDALSGLDPVVQQRVLRWAADKFNVTLPQDEKPVHEGDKRKQQQKEQEAEPPGGFPDFASLYDAVNPTTEADKALVAGYWVQVIQGNADWKGFSVNEELRNLGHGVDNITVALGVLVDDTPRLVIQTHKAGKTKQARKKYKLTAEGIKRIKQMLTGNSGSVNGGQE